MSDTTPHAAEMQAAIFRRMTLEQRLQLAMEMSEATRQMALSRIRAQHPDWTDWQLKREFLRLTLLPAALPEGLP